MFIQKGIVISLVSFSLVSFSLVCGVSDADNFVSLVDNTIFLTDNEGFEGKVCFRDL